MIDRLCEAAQNGDNDEISFLVIFKEIDPNLFHSNQHIPPIAFAALNGHLHSIKLLVSLGAKVNYDPKKNTEPLLYFAMGSAHWKSITIYLESRGLNVDLNLRIKKENPFFGASVLRWISYNNEWEFLVSLLAKKPPDELTLNYLDCKEIGRSVWDFLFDTRNNKCMSIVINQILIAYILIKNPKDFSSLKDILNQFIENTLDIWNESKKCFVKNTLITHVNLIASLYETVNLSLNLSEELTEFNKLPRKFRLKMSYHVASGFFSHVHEDSIQQLIELFEKLHQEENKQALDLKLNKLAKLVYREWRQNHLDLFMFKSPDQKSIKETYLCLIECLSLKIPGYQIPFELRQYIIEEMNKLEFNKFNKPGFLTAIDNALKTWEKTHGIPPYFSTIKLTYDQSVL